MNKNKLIRNQYYILFIVFSFCQKLTNAQCDLTNEYLYNPDFEEYTKCPTTNSQVYLLQNWEQPTTASSDFFHTCGYIGEPAINTEHLSPYPVGSSTNGTGTVGFLSAPVDRRIYVEYVGQCLKKPFEIGNKLTLKFKLSAIKYDGSTDLSSIVNYSGEIVLLGRIDCPTQEISIEGDLEGNNNFELIGEASVDMNAEDGWKDVSITFTPQKEYNYIAISIRPTTLKLKTDKKNTLHCYSVMDGLRLSKNCEECNAKIDPINQSICISESPINLSASPAGGIWSGNGINQNGEFVPSEAGGGEHDVIYTLNETCSDKITISVKEETQVTINPAGPFCLGNAPVQLKASVDDGKWSGKGVSEKGLFTPFDADQGVHEITFIPNGDCIAKSILKITVTPSLPIPIKEEFEEEFPSKNWTVDNPDGKFTWEKSTTIGVNSTASMFIHNSEYPQVGKKDALIVPELNFSSNNNSPFLTFYVAYTRFDKPSEDQLRILISDDCGLTWNEEYFKQQEELETKEVDFDESQEWVPKKDEDWRKETVNLNKYKGKKSVMIKFENTTGYGCDLWIDKINIDFTSSTDIFNNLEGSLTVAPNPNNGDFNISFNAARKESYNILITNILGEKIYSNTLDNFKGIYHNNIRITNYTKGLYILNINSKNGSIVKKIRFCCKDGI